MKNLCFFLLILLLPVIIIPQTVLYAPLVSPSAGTTDTTFIYEVATSGTYPDSVKVFIDSIGYNMTIHRNEHFTYSTFLSDTQHYYWFEAYTVVDTITLPESLFYLGPAIGNRNYYYNFDSDSFFVHTSHEWQWGFPTGPPGPPPSLPNCWGTIINGYYHGGQNKWLISPTFNLETSTSIVSTFRAWFSFEPKWDGVMLYVSTDGGNNWTKHDSVLPAYNDSIYGYNTFGWTSSVPVWRDYKIFLSQFLGDSIRIAFRFITDGTIEDYGFYMDDFLVSTKDTGNYINEINNNINNNWFEFSYILKNNYIEFSLPSYISNPIIEIYDISGRPVKELSIINNNTIIFNITDFSPGIYFAVLKNTDLSIKVPILW